MTFGEATKYGFKHMFVFEGRGRRSEYWWYYLALQLISLPIMLILMVVMFASFIPALASIDSSGQPDDGAFLASFGIFWVAYGLVFVVAIALSVMLLGAQARRLHDMGQSAQWLWLHLLSLGIVITIMCIMDSQPFTNKWGPDPKAHLRFAPGQAPVSYAAPPPYAAQPPVPPAPGGAAADPFLTPPPPPS